MANKNKLSIYLIREGLSNSEDIFDEEKNVAVYRNYMDGSVAYYIPSTVHSPKWLDDFFHEGDTFDKKNNELWQASSKVVLLKVLDFDGETRVFAITFGYAKNLFKEDVLEEQFGLKIVLNSIQQDEIRRIAKSSVGSNQKQSDEQLPKSSNISEFGFDINRDLMKNVSGKSQEEMFENAIITGGDIFSVNVSRDINNIDEFLRFCYLRYKDIAYKKNFSWIDNIKQVKDKELIIKLNHKLIDEINNENFDRVWMAVPEVISWENVKEFRFAGDSEGYMDIYIDKVISSLKNELSDIEQLKRKKIYARSSVDEERNEYEWSAFQCTISEVEIEDDQYCLNNGKWYKINTSFVEDINEQYERIELCTDTFVEYEGETEDDYNDKLVASLTDSHLLHKYKISIGGGSGNNIEPCDVFWNKNLIHVKKNGGSSTLSHLFNQALVAGEAWLEASFRDQIREKMFAAGESNCIPEPFHSYEYGIVIAIINKFADDRPKIPFFSKVAICFTATNIRNMGYTLKLKNIQGLG